MKKFFITMFLAVALIFVGSQAEAREVYVGTYSDGAAVYLLTETIQSKDTRNGSGWACTVRAGRDYLNYSFYLDAYQRYWLYENSEGYRGKVYDGSSPVAAAILNYIRN